MRILLLCTSVVLAGVTAGVLAGWAVSGDAESSPDTRQAAPPANYGFLPEDTLLFSQPRSKDLTGFQRGDVNNSALMTSPRTAPHPTFRRI